MLQETAVDALAEILESLGFDMSDIDDYLERVQASPKGRLRLVLTNWCVSALAR